MNKSLLTILALVIICSLPACKLMKVMKHPIRKHPMGDTALLAKMARDSAAKKIDTSTSAVSKEKLIQNVLPLWKQQIDFQTFSGKAKMHYEGMDKSFDFVAIIHMRKDSVIWINITGSFLGIQAQVGRLLVTPDSIKWINHLQKEATLMPMSQAEQLMPVPIGFGTLQNFILGEAMRKNGTITDVTTLPDAWALEIQDDSSVQRITYSKSDSTIANAQIAMRNNNSLHGITQFTNYFIISGHKFSTNREANFQNAGRQYYLGINFQSAEFDKELEYNFNIPASFDITH
jgi:hypothetical protein